MSVKDKFTGEIEWEHATGKNTWTIKTDSDLLNKYLEQEREQHATIEAERDQWKQRAESAEADNTRLREKMRELVDIASGHDRDSDWFVCMLHELYDAVIAAAQAADAAAEGSNADSFRLGYLCNQAWAKATGVPLIPANGSPVDLSLLQNAIGNALVAVIAAAEEGK